MQTRPLREPTARGRLLWRLLTDALDTVTIPGRTPLVLDCGGGSGRFAVPLAQAGADVTVVDVSADALATLRRRAAEAAVAARVHAVQGDVETLAEHVAGGAYDLGLAHDLLEVVDDPSATLGGLAAAVRPGGLISVLVANPTAVVLARSLVGDVAAARDELRGSAGAAPGGFDLPAIIGLCQGQGLTIELTHGIGVFAELVPEADAQPEVLAELEELAAARPPYRDIAVRLHVLARRPDR